MRAKLLRAAVLLLLLFADARSKRVPRWGRAKADVGRRRQLLNADCTVAIQYQLLRLNATGYSAGVTVFNNKQSILPAWHVTWLSANSSSLVVTQFSPILASSASASLSSGPQTTSIAPGANNGFTINATYYATSEDVLMGIESAAINSRPCQRIERSQARLTDSTAVQLGYNGCSLRQLHKRLNEGGASRDSLCTQSFCCDGGPEASPPPPPPASPPLPASSFNPKGLLSPAVQPPGPLLSTGNLPHAASRPSPSPALAGIALDAASNLDRSSTDSASSSPPSASQPPSSALTSSSGSVLSADPTMAPSLAPTLPTEQGASRQARSQDGAFGAPSGTAKDKLTASTTSNAKKPSIVAIALGSISGLMLLGLAVALFVLRRRQAVSQTTQNADQTLGLPDSLHSGVMIGISDKSKLPELPSGKIAMLNALPLLESATSGNEEGALRIAAACLKHRECCHESPSCLAASPPPLRLKQLRLDQSSQRRWNWSGELSLGFPASPTSLALPKARKLSAPPQDQRFSVPESPASAVSLVGPLEWSPLSGPESSSSRAPSPKANLEIDFVKDIVMGEKLGSGAFGSVYKGTWQGQAVAVKIMLSGYVGERSSELHSFQQEVRVLSSLQHQRIVCLLGACMAPPNICLVEELAAGGSLYDKLHSSSRSGGLPYQEVVQLAIDIADAMAYLHPTIVHRDLKSSNVLLDEQGRAKISDFGIAAFKDRTFISTRNPHAGTPSYMAPEMFEGGRVSEKIDQYAFAMLLWEALTGVVPWSTMSSPMQVIYVVGVLKKRPRIPATCPPALGNLIQRCWDDNPEARPSFPLIRGELMAERRRNALSQVGANLSVQHK